MSLSSFLLGPAQRKTEKVIDAELDDFFRSTLPEAGPSTSKPETVGPVQQVALKEVKGIKRKHAEAPSSTKAKKSRTGKDKAEEPSTVEEVTSSVVKRPITKSPKRPPVAANPQEDSDSGDDEPVASLKSKINKSERSESALAEGEEVEGDSSEDDEGDVTQLVHESVSKNAKKTASRKKQKFVPQDETPGRRDARTIFVGNVPIEVAKSKPLQNQFKKHVLSFIPTARIESVRFRSVAFKAPTSKLPPLDGSEAKGKPAPQEKSGRQHDRERAASWRATHGDDEPAPVKSSLTPKDKKRVAFIKHELHEGVDAVNAYIVFAHPPPVPENRPANLPPPLEVMDPYEAALRAAEVCEGSVFMERNLRVDVVRGDVRKDGAAGGEQPLGLGDPKATVFVGNLDFASKEQDLRAFFEGVVSVERGPPTGDADSDASDEEDGDDKPEGQGMKPKKRKTWVKRVRIIRDKDTLLGKGFAYVQFTDRECVDEILALEPERLKFAKRKLRVQRCKTVPGGTKVSSQPLQGPKHIASVAKAPRSAIPRTAPKGDPTLGTKISHLPKEERKRVKAANADRVARRMAKKKAKTLAEKGVKAKPDRERVRKPRGEKWDASAKKDKPKKRVRSGRALEKLNTKK